MVHDKIHLSTLEVLVSKTNAPSVGLYIDGMPYFERSVVDLDIAGINGIEILRGPQGTLYGAKFYRRTYQYLYLFAIRISKHYSQIELWFAERFTFRLIALSKTYTTFRTSRSRKIIIETMDFFAI